MSSKLGELFRYFFRLGFLAFGGPAAHVAMMEEDLVQGKKWLTEQEFLDYMGITNLIPGPNSTEMTMHVGYHHGGWKGVFIAGMSFIFPAVLLTCLVAVFFEEYSQIAWIVPIVNGIKAAVISFIIAAILKLGKKAVKNTYLAVIGALALVVGFLGMNEILVILTAGILSMLVQITLQSRGQLNSIILLPLFASSLIGYSHLKLFLVFLKVGLVLFGSGYVLFAYLDGELIDTLGWLSHGDLVEAIAIGQVTPGPVLSTATFVGYKLGGFTGALLATLGIFLPSFFYVLLLNKFVQKMKNNLWLRYFLEAVNVAAVAVMVVVTFKMTQHIILDWRTALICASSIAVYFSFKKLNTLWIILGGAVLGFVLSYVSL